jgi:hypothetical protein
MSLTIEAGKYYRTRDGRKVGPMVEWCKRASRPFEVTNETLGTDLSRALWRRDGTSNQGTQSDLMAECTELTETPAHIITSANGRTYDLTALETPFGLLPEDVQEALKDWPHDVIQYTDCVETGWRPHVMHKVSYHPCVTYRACPAPKVIEHVLYWEPLCDAVTTQWDEHTHSLTIRHTGDTLPDGTYAGPDGAVIVVEALT